MDQTTSERLVYYASVLLQGLGMAVVIALLAFVIAVLFGLGLALLRQSRIPFVKPAVLAYVEVFRGIPPLTLLFILYFGLTHAGIRLDSIAAAVLGLGLIGSAFCCEIFRAGLSAIPDGQWEAAAAAGMTPVQAARYVIFPQALQVTLPPLGNYLIGLFKDTAVASAVAAPEILFQARVLTVETMETPLIYAMVAVVYLVLTLLIARGVARLEVIGRRAKR